MSEQAGTRILSVPLVTCGFHNKLPAESIVFSCIRITVPKSVQLKRGFGVWREASLNTYFESSEISLPFLHAM